MSVSNFDYERELNEAKSQIFIMDRKYISNYDREVRTYARNLEPSASYIESHSSTVRVTDQPAS